MAAVALAADQTSDLLQKLSLDSPPKTNDAVEGIKQLPTTQHGSINGEAPNIPTPSERSLTPLLPDVVDPSMCYVPSGYATPAYFYGGYDGFVNDWVDYSRYANHGGMEVPPGVYGDLCQGYGYAPYNAYPSNGSSVPAMGNDGQLYGPQQYQYPVPFFPSPALTSTTQMPSPPSSQEVSTSVAADQHSIPVDTAKTNSNGIANGSTNGNNAPDTLRSSHQNPSLTLNASYGKGRLQGGLQSTGYQDPGSGSVGIRSSVPWSDGPLYSNGPQRPATTGSLSSMAKHNSNTFSARNQNQRNFPHIVGMHAPGLASGVGAAAPAFGSRTYPTNRLYGGNGLRNGFGYGSNGYDFRMNGRGGMVVDGKYKPRGRGSGFFGYGNESQDAISELNRGPRAGHFKNEKAVGPTSTNAVNGQNLCSVGNENYSLTLDREQYNREDFPDEYADAKFFIIKSYSEDDIHKSIKYNVWASTPNGNKKLDAGYQEAQEKTGGCPVFLFFSVNASGQFVGVAEMVGRVDFNKTVDYWQQDKWIGCFPLKWHIIKDVPNSILKHITLENNDNKPVTNSRDTQEVKLEQGLQMLKIFKEHVSKTCVLADFDFYENRQNLMQEKRAKQQPQKQVWAGKTCAPVEDEKAGANGKPRLQSVSVLNKEAAQVGLGERNQPEELGMAAAAGDALKLTNPAVEMHAVAHGVVNGVAHSS